MFRKPRARGNVRKRPMLLQADDGGDDDPSDGPTIVRPEKVAKPTPFVQSTKGPDRPKASADNPAAHASDRRITSYDNKVFATNEQETLRDRDAQAIFERQKELEGDELLTAAGGEKVYRGANNYRSFTKRPENFDSAVMTGQGPMRAPIHYRAVCRFDYQPDICKDYKETGFCGYGDACKFMHDRGDYKSGWQLEREWDAKEKERQRRLDAGLPEEPADEDADAAPVEELPFACLLCRNLWTLKSDPVVTKCGHHFCEACACAHFAKSKRCFACNEVTHGTFNAAKKLREQIKAKAAAAATPKGGDGEADAEEEEEEDFRRAPAREAERIRQKLSTVSAWQF
jgi:RING finger protein 113A